MAIDVMIQQKLFGNKSMPLEVILGESLHYGNFVNSIIPENKKSKYDGNHFLISEFTEEEIRVLAVQ